MGEFDAIRRLQQQYPHIGDDAAVLDGGLLAAADAVVQGIDFLEDTPLADVGWRAVAINVSDIAAMGGHTTSLLVTVAGPPAVDLDLLYAGIGEACAAYGCTVVGGDLSNGPVLMVAVTALGTLEGRAPVLRSGAQAGDGLWVSGPLGGAAAGGYGARPMARADLGPLLARLGATAMIDVSDGLAPDLGHVLDASGVGAVVDHVPVAVGATEEQAWTGGDDYELLFTLPPDVAIGVADAGADVDAGAGVDLGLIRIGTIVADVETRPAVAGGWQHRFS